MSEEKNKQSGRQSQFELEEEVLSFWQKNKVFEKSLEKTKDRPIFSFYDGPPFITGIPHYATLLPSIAKDIIPRYQTMRGKAVRRRWGWDVHGLPAEVQVEKKLGLKAKKDIEALGIEKFINACREYVKEGSDAWRWYIDHIGRWADIDNAYRTDQLSFMESTIWAFKQLYEKELIYRGSRTSLYCTRCATPLSKFEVTMDEGSYKDVDDPSVTVAFKILDRENTYALAWTTTPWTLSANTALAVSEDLDYIFLSDGRKTYIVAESARERYPELAGWRVEEKVTGKELVGLGYEPLYPRSDAAKVTVNYRLYGAEFVSIEEGTGIVHIAPAYGEDDANFGRTHSLSAPLTTDDEGRMLADESARPWDGIFYKDADALILEDLTNRGLLVKKETVTHSYPHCYRCGTSLIYRSQEAWYLKIDPLREKLLKQNESINWAPEHFGKKRFVYNLENAPDWCISRTRYWATPVPVWQTDDGELIVPGSIKEIEEMSGQKVTDLHRPTIDEIVLKTKDGKKAHRVKEVLDCWFESGSMPYAQDHFPFENEQLFKTHFPSDYIVEYTGQLRGWFYYLHVLANALFDENAYKNVAVTGVLMGTDGRKMSKSFGNYPDPRRTIEKYGADALRLYFMSSKIMRGEDTSISEEDIRQCYRQLQILRNVLSYYKTYGGRDSAKAESNHILDRWIKARVKELAKTYSEELDGYDFVASTAAIAPFIEDLSTWYVRHSRERFVAGDSGAIATLKEVLRDFCLIVAPTLPFTADAIYRELTGEESVHLANYPEFAPLSGEEKELLKPDKMTLVQKILPVVFMIRDEKNIPLRQPLGSLKLAEEDFKSLVGEAGLIEVLKSGSNVKEVKFVSKSSIDENQWAAAPGGAIYLETEITKELKEEGQLRELLRALQEARKNAGLKVGEVVSLRYACGDELNKLIKNGEMRIKEAAKFSSLERVEGTESLKKTSIEGLSVSLPA